MEIVNVNEIKENIFPKKANINSYKPQNNDDYTSLCPYSNQLYISSKNNMPILLEKIDPDAIKSKEVEKEKDLLNHYKIFGDKENIINNNDTIVNENNENKIEINNFNQIKNFHVENKIRKDSIISEFPYYGNFNNNFFIEPSLFNMNCLNFYNMCLNKNENEVY